MTTVMDSPSLSHRQTWDLIPWIVNDSATTADRERIEEHLRTCMDCRDEYAFQSQLHAGMTVESTSEHDPQPAFRRLLARIDGDRADDGVNPDAAIHATQPATGRRQGLSARGRSRWTRYQARVLVAAVIAQSVGLVLLGALLLGRDRAPDSNARYETLSHTSASAGAATIRFVPMPTLTVGAMQAILAEAKVRIVESNQGSSIYGLAPDPGSQSAETTETPAERATKTAVALARLRAQQGVLLAEPIASPATGSR
jgi:hypothetical protein